MEMGPHASRTIHFTLLILPASKKKRGVLPHLSFYVLRARTDERRTSSKRLACGNRMEAFTKKVEIDQVAFM
jgi:hypothetical protein